MGTAVSRWHDLEPTDASVFTTAAQVYRFPVRLRVPPQRVWESLASDASLADWGLGVSIRWTSPRPFGVDTTREVTLPLHSMTLRERFFRWDEGAGYSFHVVQANRPWFRRFAEDYTVEVDGSGSLLTWTIALDPVGMLGTVMGLTGPVNRIALGQFGAGARRYFAKNP